MVLTNPPARKVYPVERRRVRAMVEVDGELREMVFLTINLTWSAQTIADLYRFIGETWNLTGEHG